MSEQFTPLPDADARQQIQNDLDVSMLVEASAGTGKTTSMVQRLVNMVARGVKVDSIAAITFTRKAAAELRSRFLSALQQAATVAGSGDAAGEQARNFIAAMDRIDSCYIGTIHSFCGRLLREYPRGAGVAMNFRELTESEDAQLRQQAFNDYAASAFLDDSTNVLPALADMGMSLNDLLDPFCNMFCNYPDVDSWPVDDVEFPDSAQLAAVLRQLDGYIDHINTIAGQLPVGSNDQLINNVFLSLGESIHSLDRDSAGDIIGFLMQFKPSYKVVQKCWPGKKDQAIEERDRWEDFYRKYIQGVIDTALAGRYKLAMEIFRDVRLRYDQLRRRQGAVNFNDLLLKTRDLLVADADIRYRCQRRLRHLLVDEFQDTDPIQGEIMLLLTADDAAENDWRQCRPRPGSLFVVGDPKQSIYRFRRADIETYNFVRKRIEDCGGRVCKLTANFRSCSSVIDWVNDRFSQMFAVDSAATQASYDYMHSGRDFSASVAADIDGVTLLSDDIEARRSDEVIDQDTAQICGFITDAIASGKTIADFDDSGSCILRRVRPDDFMILTYSARQLGSYAAALQQYGVPVSVTGGGEFNMRSEPQLLLKIVRAISSSDDALAIVAVLRSELHGFTDAELLEFKRAGGRFDLNCKIESLDLADSLAGRFAVAWRQLRSCRNLLNSSLAIDVIVERILNISGIVYYFSQQNSQRSSAAAATIWQLLELAGDKCSGGSLAELTELLEEIVAARVRYDLPALSPGDFDGVRLMNLHKAKGLEAAIVILAYPRGRTSHAIKLHVKRERDVSGYMNISTAIGDLPNASRLIARPLDWVDHEFAEREFLDAEAARLLYVAATRAGRQLIISSNKGKYEKQDPWHALSRDMERRLPSRAAVSLDIDREVEKISADQLQQNIDALAARKQALLASSYLESSARQLALTDELDLSGQAQLDARGSQWGSCVHAMLQFVAAAADGDMHLHARQLCSVYEFDENAADELVALTKSVMASDLWQRATAAGQMISEMPFELLAADSDNTSSGKLHIISGVIDLLFREADGWVIADYKTDAAAAEPKSLAKLTDHYRPQLEAYRRYFEQATGEKVKQLGIFFTAIGSYVVL